MKLEDAELALMARISRLQPSSVHRSPSASAVETAAPMAKTRARSHEAAAPKQVEAPSKTRSGSGALHGGRSAPAAFGDIMA